MIGIILRLGKNVEWQVGLDYEMKTLKTKLVIKRWQLDNLSEVPGEHIPVVAVKSVYTTKKKGKYINKHLR